MADKCPFCGAEPSDTTACDSLFTCGVLSEGVGLWVRSAHCYEREISTLKDALNDWEDNAPGEIAALKAEVERLRFLLYCRTDSEECQYDHHGVCQTHYSRTQPCANGKARKLLADYDPTAASLLADAPPSAGKE